MADIFERNGARPAREPGRKIGQGHAQAMARLGLRELRNAANPSPQSVADTEMGLYGTAGPAEVAQTQGVETRGSRTRQDQPKQARKSEQARKPEQPSKQGREH